ncbi:MAG: DUF58 domain-containing protein [Armatimonadetes bacterium]|nr:DUF58 domain-containing protein [Armatimonadota bacterium]MDW8026822.1 DUF58 domain-containing protein [Armatimonadota bacterium]
MKQSLWQFLKESLAKLGRAELTARRAVEGTLTGRHKSPFRGFSVEFAEHRPYFPGDDLRYLDWKALAKLDKLFVRQFEQETNMRCYLLLDSSGSMGYSSENGSKLDYAVKLAALISYLVLRQGDAIGLAVFSEKLRKFIPARRSSSHLHVILENLEEIKPEGQTHLRRVTEELSALLKRRSLLVMISDLLDEDGALLRALSYLQRRGHDILVLQILDPDELNFPFSLPSMFIDAEEPMQLPIDPENLRLSYKRRVEKFLRECKQACGQSGAHYLRLMTDKDPSSALGFYLAWRSKRSTRLNGYQPSLSGG